MGYSYCVNDSSFGIEAQHFPDMMDHLLKWHRKLAADNQPLKWMDHDKAIAMLEEGDLIGYFDGWCYAAKIDITTGDVVNLIFEGEKIGQEDNLWDQIAPWVQDGSHLTCQGEDGDMWRWTWREGRLYTVEAQVVYDDPIDCGYHTHPAAWMNDELNAARKAVGWVEPKNAVESEKPQIIKCDTQYALNALRLEAP